MASAKNSAQPPLRRRAWGLFVVVVVVVANLAHARNVTWPPKDRKPALWVHIHKAGGSTTCKWAQSEGERVMKPNINCNYKGRPVDGTGRMFEPEEEAAQNNGKYTCEDRYADFKTQRATWSQIEHEVDASLLLCSRQFLYGAMLREPAALAKSVVYYEGFKPATVVAYVNGSLDALETLRSPSGYDWRVFDNFVVRSLSGAAGFNAPLGALGQKELQFAEQFLDDLDVLAVLERLDDRDYAQFLDVFLWQRPGKHRPPHENANRAKTRGAVTANMPGASGLSHPTQRPQRGAVTSSRSSSSLIAVRHDSATSDRVSAALRDAAERRRRQREIELATFRARHSNGRRRRLRGERNETTQTTTTTQRDLDFPLGFDDLFRQLNPLDVALYEYANASAARRSRESAERLAMRDFASSSRRR